jgi:serine/threonine-protein kinase
MITERQSTDEMADTTEIDGVLEQRVLGGRYRIVRRLAAGGMGVVYEAHHRVLRRSFAVKVLRRQALRDPEATARLRREAMAVAELESEHIASVVDFGEDETGSPYLVMELLRGTDLHGLLDAEHRIAAPRACDLVVQACHGLERAHARGIVHRDLKPRNLFVCRRADGGDLVKVLDFGIAKLHGATDPATLQTGARILGTLGYMAPEQIECASRVDARADVYSLGVVLYRCIAGRMPYSGGTPAETLHQILYEQPEALSATAVDICPELAAIVHRALARLPEHRFSSVAELRAALSRHTAQSRSLPDTVSPISWRVQPRPQSRRQWLGVAAIAAVIPLAAMVLPMQKTEPAAGSGPPVEGVGGIDSPHAQAQPVESSRPETPSDRRLAGAANACPSASSAAASPRSQPRVPTQPPPVDPDQAFVPHNRVAFDDTNPYK